jgi:hypothetical protein
MKMIAESEDFADNDWWWFDSICINQNDTTERDAQVKIME